MCGINAQAVFNSTSCQCLRTDILGDNWNPALTLEKTLLCLSARLAAPEPECSMDEAASKMYLADREAFNKTARDWTELFAMGDGDINAEKVQSKIKTGFDEETVVNALQVTGKDENAALELLLAV